MERWDALEKVASCSPSGVRLVDLGDLEINAPSETSGHAARGFKVDVETVRKAVVDRVVTRVDGAVGVQLCQLIGVLHVRRDIETHRGIGDSLVEGAVRQSVALPRRHKPGGGAKSILIEGGLKSHGKDVEALEMQRSIEEPVSRGGLSAIGTDFAKM